MTIRMRTLLAALAALALATFFAAGCSDRVTESNGDASTIAISLNLTSPDLAAQISSFRVTISGPNMTDTIVPLTWNPPFVEGDFRVPSGRNRRFVVEALDEDGTVIYRGTQVVDVFPGTITRLVVYLRPVVSMVKTAPHALTLVPNVTFTLPVRVYNIDSLYGISLRILWDNAVVQADSVRLALVASATAADFILFGQPNYESRYYAVTLTRTDQATPLVDANGNASILTVFFSTLGAPDDNGFARITVDVTGMTKPNGDSITVAGVHEEGTDVTVSTLVSDGIEFADANFEAAVRTALETPTGPISPSLASELATLQAANRGITDLRGLSYFTGLQQLYLSGNRITDITPLMSLGNLQVLDLTGNAIFDVAPLTGLVNLQSLGLANNQIADISPLVGNLGLGTGDDIYLYSNPLSTVSTGVYIPILEARGVNVQD